MDRDQAEQLIQESKRIGDKLDLICAALSPLCLIPPKPPSADQEMSDKRGKGIRRFPFFLRRRETFE